MIGNSKPEYYFIKLSIFGLHYLAPLCLLYCVFVVAAHGFSAATRPLPLVIETVAVAESLFLLVVYLPYRYHLQKDAVHPPPPTREERRELFQLCNDNIEDPEAYLRKWFLGAELNEIKRENVKDFLLWAFFNRDGPPGDDDEELEEYVTATEKDLGQPIEAGRGKARCLRLTLDRVDMLHRSLTWYFCIGFVDFLTYLKLLFHGFHFHRLRLARFFTLFPLRPISLITSYTTPAKHTAYWHRPHTSKTKLPVVFIHGIGIGLYPYTNFLNELNSVAGIESTDRNEQVGIIAIEIMPVSSRITHSALGREELCTEINQILSNHFAEDQKFVLASHSYGTVVTTWLLKTPSISSRIGPVVLIDPVSILLHLPDVAYNFTRRKPQRANEHQLHYFGSMDMGVSHSLARHFFWNENVLWKKDFGDRKVTVALSGKDLIVDTGAVGRYLSRDSGVSTITKLRSNGHAKSNGNGNRGPHRIVADGKDNNVSSQPLLQGQSGYGTNENDEAEWKSRAWKGTGVDVLWFSDLDHAQVFDKAATRKKVIDAIRSYCEHA